MIQVHKLRKKCAHDSTNLTTALTGTFRHQSLSYCGAGVGVRSLSSESSRLCEAEERY